MEIKQIDEVKGKLQTVLERWAQVDPLFTRWSVCLPEWQRWAGNRKSYKRVTFQRQNIYGF